MKRIMILLAGMVAVTMVLGIAPVMMASEEEIPFIEVEWRPVSSLSPKLYRAVTGIFVERCGAIRVVDSHPYRMGGRRVWLSKDGGQTWILEKESGRAKRDIERMLGRERAKVVLAPRGSRLFAEWPKETRSGPRSLLRTAFRKWYKHDPHGSGWGFAPLRRDPNYPERMIFATSGSPDMFRVFVSLNNGEQWIETSTPRGAGGDRGRAIFAVAIKSTKDNIVLYVGLLVGGEDMLQYAVLPLPREELLAEK